MLKIKENMKIILSLILLAFVGTGCFPLVIGAAAGASGVIWAKGELRETFRQPLLKVYPATLQALKDLEINILSDRKDDLVAKIKAELVDGREIHITIDHLTSNSSKLSLRIGVLGDEGKSREILSRIHEQL